jgi:predicted nicotinamide N-methyase
MVRPPDAEALIDEDAFARDEFLPYWAELWPSARVLAGYVAELPLAGTRAVELGCGVGLPSLVVALAGADVVATDCPRMRSSRASSATNGLRVETLLACLSPHAPQEQEAVRRDCALPTAGLTIVD